MPVDPETLMSPDAGRGAGVEFHGSVYPFVLPSSDVRGLLSDFWLSHDDAAVVGPLRISTFYHFGRPLGLESAAPPGEHDCDLVVVDANNYVVCDTRTADSYTGQAFGLRFYVHEWRLADRICRAVQHSKLHLSAEEILLDPIPSLIVPDSAVLDERTHEKLPARLLSITVGEDVLQGNIRLSAGYNMQIETNARTRLSAPNLISPSLLQGGGSALRLTENRISFAIVPGAGQGRSPGCSGGEIGLRSINNAKPTPRGHLLLAGLACIDVSQPPRPGRPLELIPSTLQLGNHCTACCDCADYVAAYKRLRAVYDRLVVVAALAEEIRDTYHRLLDRWLASKASCEAHPLQVETLGARYVRLSDDGLLIYNVTYVTVSAEVCNTTDFCMFDVNLTLDCTFATELSGTILNGSLFQTTDAGAVITRALEGEWPTYVAHWDRLSVHQSVRVQFTIFWASEEVVTPSGEFQVCASAEASGVTLPPDGTPQVICDSVTVNTQEF